MPKQRLNVFQKGFDCHPKRKHAKNLGIQKGEHVSKDMN
jgi:hypothetical protein